MKCNLCGKICVDRDDLQLHRIDSCPAIENGNDDIQPIEKKSIIFRWQRHLGISGVFKEVHIIVSDLDDHVELYQTDTFCYHSAKMLVSCGEYSGQLILGDEILPFINFKIDNTSDIIDICLQEVQASPEPVTQCISGVEHETGDEEENENNYQVQMFSPENKLISVNANSTTTNSLQANSLSTISTVRTDYTLNRDLALSKKRNGCDKPLYVIEENKDSTVVRLSTASFDYFTKALEVHLASKHDKEYIVTLYDQQDQGNSVTQDIIRVLNNGGNNSLLFTVNLYRTKNSVMVNGASHLTFRKYDLPVIKKQIQESAGEIITKNRLIKDSLSHICTPTHQSQRSIQEREKPNI